MIKVLPLADGLVELCFDRTGAAINKLDRKTIEEWRAATAQIGANADVRGVLVTSAKDAFIVGADINEFGAMFQLDDERMTAGTLRSNEVLNAFEDLDVPTVVAINGLALGGGLEMTLSASARVMAVTAQVGLPEVKLGLFPGLGGTVRMARLAGVAAAAEWIADGKPRQAGAALEAGVVDKVCVPEALRETALALLRDAAAGRLDWRAARQRKYLPVAAAMHNALNATRAGLPGAAAHQPAAAMALALLEDAAGLDRDGALLLEARRFTRVARTQAAASLVQIFHNEQALKKLARRHGADGGKVARAAVLGAGIMGGGIAYATALHGTPVRLKDLSEQKLAAGVGEAERQLARQVRTGRLPQARAAAVLASITPQLDFAGFDGVELAVEAVVENLAVKHAVLRELEAELGEGAVIATNTSSLRIADIAAPLARPGNLVGMHFFNPVPAMPLVEVIQGPMTSGAAVATAAGFVVAMGKTPIVVKDCPGFLVNRVLTAYIRAFLQLVAEGADFEQVDRAMEAFGWPMGPAWLEDVIGIDTGSHVNDVISAGYPERMPPLAQDALRLMAEHQRHGQKNGAGFYRYAAGPDGRGQRSPAPEAHALLAQIQPNGRREFGDGEIVERLMLPLMVEAARALEDGVAGSTAEIDMALLLGLGFPKYLGGPLKYMDWLGMDQVLRQCEKYAHLGEQYVATPAMRAMAAAGARYH
jgi:3-hydroxyacyl-CoA dehydrogenase/enoyl-CoA hydratase/3-hydroxybutyryl-CoA epimerase/enoyl-CoA isomerase